MHVHELSLPAVPADLARVTMILKALGDPTRLHLVLHLAHAERTVKDLVDALDQPQSTISRHLAVLRAAGLVTPRRAGTSVHYRLSDTHVATLVHEAFAHLEHQRLGLPDHPAALPAGRAR